MNLPNKITIVRIFLLPVFIFFYLAKFIPCNYLIAGIIFTIAAFTDFLDGYLARKNNQVTNLGKLLDPIADKLIVMAGLLLVTVDGTIPNPYGIIIFVIIIGRELIISAFRQVAASRGIVMAADKWGKYKTFITDISIPLLMLLAECVNSGWLKGNYLFAFEIINYVLIGVATLLTIISAVNYLVKNKQVLKEPKQIEEKNN